MRSIIVDLATAIETAISDEDLTVTARSADSPFYHLLHPDFGLAVQCQVILIREHRATAKYEFILWVREHDSRMVIDEEFSELAEESFEGSQRDAYTWIIERIRLSLYV